VPEHEVVLAVGRDAEDARRDLAVGAAHAHLERPQQDLAGAGARVGDVLDAGRVGDAR
jgi:hypothetical protein